MPINFPTLKNDLLLQALTGKPVSRPPVWMMRQAGRYLPDYMKLRDKYTFFERVENPELVSEITIMPIDQIGCDAAILFSDILVIPQALGFEVTMSPGEGPRLPEPVSTVEQAMALSVPDVEERLHYVLEAITLTRKELNGRVPLIGFAGAPWTIMCYMIQGRGSRDFAKAKQFCYQHPKAATHLLNIISEITIKYLNAQVNAGAQAIQIFDSWSGLLSPEDFSKYSMPWLVKITKAIKEVPVILFAKGSWYALQDLAKFSGASALSLDWTISPEYARKVAGDITLQGNYDPSRLLSPISEIKRDVNKMIDLFGKNRYIVNLGHGILPHIPVDHARAFVETVKEYKG
ncbi:MAG: uroporphyrinogen decarboxylase [Balneolales bacterium]